MADSEEVFVRFRKGKLDADRLQIKLERLWLDSLRSDPELRSALAAARYVSEHEVSQCPTSPFRFEPDRSGTMGVDIVLVLAVSFAKDVFVGAITDEAKALVRERVRKILKQVFVPKLRNALGDDERDLGAQEDDDAWHD